MPSPAIGDQSPCVTWMPLRGVAALHAGDSPSGAGNNDNNME
jgi:hypothetical protein